MYYIDRKRNLHKLTLFPTLPTKLRKIFYPPVRKFVKSENEKIEMEKLLVEFL